MPKTGFLFISALALIFFSVISIASADSSGVFGIRTGFGYDYISQEYFLDSLRLTGEDSALSATLLKRDYLDDKKGFIFMNLDNRDIFGKEHQYYFEAGWEQTDEIYRGRMTAEYEFKGDKNNFESYLDFDIKKQYSGEPSAGEESTVFDSYFRVKRKIAEYSEVSFKGYFESVSFDSATSFIYNYNKFGGRASLDLISENFNTLSFSLTGELRDVPDSGDLDYGLIRGDVSYFGGFWGSLSTLDLSLEYRNYKIPGDLDDYFMTSFYGSFDWPLGGDYSTEFSSDLEYFNYTNNDFVNSDYFQGRFELLLKREINFLTLSAGPKTEIFRVNSDYSDDDDYLEIGGLIGADYISLNGGLILVENQLGFRDYQATQVYTSDFLFDRLSLIGSLNLWAGLSFDLFLSAEWEWHKIDSDDNTIYLITSALSYTI